MILLKSILKKAAEWYGLSLRTITLDLVKEESITTENKSKAMEIFLVPENESNIIELTS